MQQQNSSLPLIPEQTICQISSTSHRNKQYHVGKYLQFIQLCTRRWVKITCNMFRPRAPLTSYWRNINGNRVCSSYTLSLSKRRHYLSSVFLALWSAQWLYASLHLVSIDENDRLKVQLWYGCYGHSALNAHSPPEPDETKRQAEEHRDESESLDLPGPASGSRPAASTTCIPLDSMFTYRLLDVLIRAAGLALRLWS